MIDPVARAAIPFSAFADAVEEQEADSATDNEGDMMNAQFFAGVEWDCLKNIYYRFSAFTIKKFVTKQYYIFLYVSMDVFLLKYCD